MLSAIISFLRGFIKEVLTIVGLAGGTFAAYTLAPLIEPSFQEWLIDPDNKDEKLWDLIPMEIVASVSAYGLCFIITFIALSIASHFLSKSIKEMGLGAVDRSVGVIFGLLRGLLLISLIYLPFSLLMEKDSFPDWVKDSKTIPVIEYTIDTTYDVFDIDPPTDKNDKNTPEDLSERLNAVEKFLPKGAQKHLQKAIDDKIKSSVETTAKPKDTTGTGYKKDDRMELNKLFEKTE